MKQRRTLRHLVLAVLVAGVALVPAQAADVEKKFRLSGTLGIVNPQDSIQSDAGNVLTLVDDALTFDSFYIDPRNDSAVFGELDLNPTVNVTVAAQYAVTKIFIVEGSVGYGKHDLGDVEMQAQLTGTVVPQFQPFLFQVARIPVGTVERIPVQVTGLVRFRPRANFNPYAGFGIGYSFHGFNVDGEFNELSAAIDGSLGAIAAVSEATFGSPGFTTPGASSLQDLTGARVKIDDAFEYHAVLGAEYSFKRKWALILDFRWTQSNEDVRVSFNGEDDLGSAVPERVDFADSSFATDVYGPMYIPNGGLRDFGSLVPGPTAPMGTNCAVSSFNCVFDTTAPDGVVDPGFYYVQGGKFELGGINLQLGLRYTF